MNALRTRALLHAAGISLASAAVVSAGSTIAAPREGIPARDSCYQAHGALGSQPLPRREYVIAIDETLLLPAELARVLRSTVSESLSAGDRVTIVRFSAYTSEHHVQQRLQVHIPADPGADEVRRIPVARLSALKRCLEIERLSSVRSVLQEVPSAVEVSAARFERSEIVETMRTLGRRLADSPASSKTLLMISDGLEHAPGDTTSFYAERGVRLIDAAAEAERLRAMDRLSGLKGVQVYFFGGVMPTAGTAGFRNAGAVKAIEAFWRRYVAMSGGTLMEFGSPELQTRIK